MVEDYSNRALNINELTKFAWMRTFFQYIRNPVLTESINPFTLRVYFRIMGMVLLLALITTIFVVVLNRFMVLPERTYPRLDSPVIFLILVVIGPLFEEILFRLNLVVTRINCAIFVTVLIIILLKIGFFQAGEFYIYLGVLPLFPMFYYIFLKTDYPFRFIAQFVKINFRYLFHLLAITFGMLHIFNYQTVYWWMVLLFPIITGPYIVIGYVLGYTRMRYGFANGWLIHSSINFVFAFFAMPKHFM